MEREMGQVLIRNVPDSTIETYRSKARLNGRSLEEELRLLLEKNRSFTPQERVAFADEVRSQSKLSPAFTLDEIREGLR
jgi:antitoxin FitA